MRPSASCGPVAGQVLSCARFGFSYTVPFGWVDRTGDVQGDREETVEGQSSGRISHSEVLLAVFERPPNAPGNTINSTVLIAAESLANYPRLKTAADYFAPISEVAEQRGFKAVDEPYAFPVGSKRLVREDFRAPRGKLTMYQASLATIERGYIVSFTVIAGSEDEIEDLIGRVSFGGKQQP